MTAMLAYSLRKRIPGLRRAGRLGTWLDLHIWCGVTGPLLIVLHSALKVGGLIAIAFWSMVAVALSGVFGRFLYAQIPRTASGDQLSLDEARRLDAELTARLRDEFDLSASDLAPLRAAAGGASRSVAAALAALAVEPWRRRRRLARFRARARAPARARRSRAWRSSPDSARCSTAGWRSGAACTSSSTTGTSSTSRSRC